MNTLGNPPSSLRTVLYVDDHPDGCEVVQTTLCLMGMLEVHTAPPGDAAIRRAYEFLPDFILLAVRSFDADVPLTLRLLRERALLASIPVACLTFAASSAAVAKLQGLAATGVIEATPDHNRLCEHVVTLWKKAQLAVASTAVMDRVPGGARGDPLTAQFLEQAAQDATRMRHRLLHAGECHRAAFREVGHSAHTMRGAAAMFGYPALASVYAAVEQLAAQGGASHDTRPLEVAGLLQQLIFRLDELGDEIAMAAYREPSATAMFQGDRVTS